MKSSSRFSCVGLLLVVAILVISLAACGGGGGTGSGSVTPAAPAPTVTISASPTSVTLNSAGMASSALTWSTSGSVTSTSASSNPSRSDWTGSKNPSGTQAVSFTAPGTYQFTVASTGPGGTSAPATASVTVLAGPPSRTISVTGMKNAFVTLPSPGIVPNQVLGSGFQSDDNLTATAGITLTPAPTFVSSIEWDVSLAFGTNEFTPDWKSVEVCSHDNSVCAVNPGRFAFLGAGENWLVSNGSGVFFQLHGGNITKFNAGGSLGDTAVGTSASAITWDLTSNLLAIANGSSGPVSFRDANNPSTFGGANVSGSVAGIASANGTGCAAQPVEGKLTCFPMDRLSSVTTSITLGNRPTSVAMTNVGGEHDAFVVLSGTNQLARIRVSDMSVQPTSTSLVTLPGPTGGIPRVVTFQNGTVAVLVNGNVVIVDPTTMTITRTVSLGDSATAKVVQVLPDDLAGTIILFIANPSTQFTTFAKLNVSTGVITPYTSSSIMLLGMDAQLSGGDIAVGANGQHTLVVIQ